MNDRVSRTFVLLATSKGFGKTSHLAQSRSASERKVSPTGLHCFGDFGILIPPGHENQLFACGQKPAVSTQILPISGELYNS